MAQEKAKHSNVKQLCESWKVIHDHHTLTFATLQSALAYAKGYARSFEIVEIVDSDEREIVLLSDMDRLASQLVA